jgi:UPF0755 protein
MLDGLDLGYDDDGDGAMRPGRHRRRRSGRGKSLFALVLVVVLLGVLGGGGYLGYHALRGFLAAPDYAGAGHGSVKVQIKTGDGLSDMANALYKKDVVKSAKAFVDASNKNPNSTSIQPGWYKLHKQMKASLAVTALLDLKNRIATKVTIPEGLTMNATLSLLSKGLKLPMADLKKAAKDPAALGIDKGWFARDDHKPAAKTVEGFLYPDTYLFDPGTTAKDALTEMVSHFMKAAADSGLDQPKGITPYEALIVASITQGEAINEDMPKVARVIYNRLGNPNMQRLQCDSTTNYWLDLHGKGAKESSQLTRAELNDPDNPYSTTAHPGLPPGPIDSPGAIAMKAATHPAHGDWLYFVRIDKSGKSAFAVTEAQHEANVAKAKKNGAG